VQRTRLKTPSICFEHDYKVNEKILDHFEKKFDIKNEGSIRISPFGKRNRLVRRA